MSKTRVAVLVIGAGVLLFGIGTKNLAAGIFGAVVVVATLAMGDKE